MATVIVRRGVRRPAPEMPSGELILQPPPEIPKPQARQWQQALMVLPMMAMMAAMVIMFSGSAAGPMRLVLFGVVGAAMLVMVVGSLLRGNGPSKREMGFARREYLRELAQHRKRMTRAIGQQRDAMAYLHPEPGALWFVAAGERLWERRPSDVDFAVARIGRGPQRPAKNAVAPDTQPLERLEPLSALALRRFVTTYAAVGDLPLAIAMGGFSRIDVHGDRERARGMVRALIAQLVTLHAPDDVRIAVCAGQTRRPEWEWVKWLPHACHPDKVDAVGPVRLVTPTVADMESILDTVLAKRPRFDPGNDGRTAVPHVVVVIDGADETGAELFATGVEGVTVVDIGGGGGRAASRSAITLTVSADGALTGETLEGTVELGTADAMDVASAEGLARQLAPLRLTAGGHEENALAVDLGLGDLLGIDDPYALDPAGAWLPRPSRERLRIRFGVRTDGTPVELDLKESAQDGMGPHGLLVGATGSGKSELLRTLVLGLAITHAPSSLNFALIDFKGGATFTRLDKLPHTSAVITNLADELPLVDRMTDAINGELIRRQELLRAAGNFASLRDYEKARAAGAPLPEVPTLLVVCDEFSELLTAKPDFIEMFVQIGRVGRSLGVHLLLASQRLEEGRLRGLDTHLSYRIGLRTFSDMESRAVLGVGDAARLPREPGHGLLKCGTEPMTRFRSAYVSGVHVDRTPQTVHNGPQREPGVPFTSDYVAPDVEQDEVEPEVDEDAVGDSLLDILVDRLTGRGTPAHPVWLPPLDTPPTLDELLGTPAVDPERGLSALRPGGLKAVIGIVDRPFDQRRDPLILDLSGGAGHALVIGGPHSGKSTALRSIVASLALTHTPREVQFYCLDFGGGALGALRGLPHVGGVAGRQNEGAVRRTVAEVATVLAERERRFAAENVDGIGDYRARKAAGEFGGDRHGDVFLVVDGWATLRSDFEDVEQRVMDIAARGLAYGVHVVVSCSRAFDLRPNVRDLLGSRIELRLGDPIDSVLDRKAAELVPEDTPGRGVAPSKHQMLIALPRIDSSSTVDDLADGVSGLVRAVAQAWRGPAAPEVRLLPGTLPYADLPEASARSLCATLGIAESDLGPVVHDFDAEPHLLLLGDVESGKTAFLRAVARQITDRYDPDRARLVVVDHRRGLLGEISTEHQLGYGTDRTSTATLIERTAKEMAKRLPGENVTPEELRSRSWWSGPDLFVLIDDYDLVGNPHENPLAPLLDFLPHGRDVGLHVVLTRRIGGASRAMFDPFIARLRDVGSSGIMLSGSKEEGPLLGGLKPEPLPPGRGKLISRKRGSGELIQLALLEPSV